MCSDYILILSCRFMSSYAQQPRILMKQVLASLLKQPSVFRSPSHLSPGLLVQWTDGCFVTHPQLYLMQQCFLMSRPAEGLWFYLTFKLRRFPDTRRRNQRWKTIIHSNLTPQSVHTFALVPLPQVHGATWPTTYCHSAAREPRVQGSLSEQKAL